MFFKWKRLSPEEELSKLLEDARAKVAVVEELRKRKKALDQALHELSRNLAAEDRKLGAETAALVQLRDPAIKGGRIREVNDLSIKISNLEKRRVEIRKTLKRQKDELEAVEKAHLAAQPKATEAMRRHDARELEIRGPQVRVPRELTDQEKFNAAAATEFKAARDDLERLRAELAAANLLVQTFVASQTGERTPESGRENPEDRRADLASSIAAAEQRYALAKVQMSKSTQRGPI